MMGTLIASATQQELPEPHAAGMIACHAARNGCWYIWWLQTRFIDTDTLTHFFREDEELECDLRHFIPLRHS